MSLSCMLAGLSTRFPSISLSFSRTLETAREDEDLICSMRLLLLARLRLLSGSGEWSSAFVIWMIGIAFSLLLLAIDLLFESAMMLPRELMSTNCLATSSVDIVTHLAFNNMDGQ
jgi:hypothetical protein